MVTTAGAAASGSRSRTLTAHGTAASGNRNYSDFIQLFFQILRSALRAFSRRIKTGQQQFKLSIAAAAYVTEYRHNQRIPVLLTINTGLLRALLLVRTNLNTLARSSSRMISGISALRE